MKTIIKIHLIARGYILILFFSDWMLNLTNERLHFFQKSWIIFYHRNNAHSSAGTHKKHKKQKSIQYNANQKFFLLFFTKRFFFITKNGKRIHSLPAILHRSFSKNFPQRIQKWFNFLSSFKSKLNCIKFLYVNCIPCIG